MAHLNDLLVSNGDMSDDIESPSVNVQYQVIGAIQCVFTGSPVGSIKLQASCDPVAPTPSSTPTATSWTDIADTTVGISAAGNVLYNISNYGFDQIRVVYTRTSGTGALQVRVITKG